MAMINLIRQIKLLSEYSSKKLMNEAELQRIFVVLAVFLCITIHTRRVFPVYEHLKLV